MLNKLNAWRQSEPVRLWLYPLLGLVLGAFVTQGVMTADVADMVSAIASMVFGIPAIEVARSRVASPATVAALTAVPEPPAGPTVEEVTAHLRHVQNAVNAALEGGTPSYFPILVQLRSQLARVTQ